MYIYIHTCLCTYVYTCVYLCTYVCTYIHVYTYLHTLNVLIIVGAKRHKSISIEKAPPNFGECFWQLEKTDNSLRGKLIIIGDVRVYYTSLTIRIHRMFSAVLIC